MVTVAALVAMDVVRSTTYLSNSGDSCCKRDERRIRAETGEMFRWRRVDLYSVGLVESGACM